MGGYVDDNNKKYFDFRAFGKDLRTSRNCIELTSGRILFNIIFPPSWDTEERREHAVLKSRRFYTNRPSEPIVSNDFNVYTDKGPYMVPYFVWGNIFLY